MRDVSSLTLASSVSCAWHPGKVEEVEDIQILEFVDCRRVRSGRMV